MQRKRPPTPGIGQDPSTMEFEAVARALAADLEVGLTAAEAARRLDEDGPRSAPTPA